MTLDSRLNRRIGKKGPVAIRRNDPSATSLLHPFMNFKGFLAVGAYRISHELWVGNRRSLAYYIQNRASEIFGVDIHPAAKIGRGVFLDHGTGVVIGETAIVGDDVTIPMTAPDAVHRQMA